MESGAKHACAAAAAALVVYEGWETITPTHLLRGTLKLVNVFKKESDNQCHLLERNQDKVVRTRAL